MSKDQKLKLIWDFHGPDAEITAKHHAVHLREFLNKNTLSLDISGSEKLSNTHAIAFMVVTKAEMPPVRDALKPHRGQLYED
ncbi:hypothetical protein JRG66_03655 [Salinimicrobium tongyeongense]|uniref:Uncharacterized protein n=1 Tax=Salinimicrobium tongyeongense TaxID=2809707 RepID=A0ABY6NSU6_9FLAO|nr:hypothetical protein [Salinimicrobium tongyeongense]UZH55980.1 hypothetical protein JRG66_03655 [Salinimicrobium tongyeongense]